MDAEMMKVSTESEVAAKCEVLPHELLLMVLAHLDSRQLLQVRAVCRQWRDAALDPVLWRSRSLRFERERLRCAWLRLAPCVRVLSTELRGDAVLAAACSTRCAAEELHLDFDAESAGFAATAVRNQESLGRLRGIVLRPKELSRRGCRSCSRLGRAAMLVDVVCRVEGLSALHFAPDDYSLEWDAQTLPTPDKAVPASLEVLVDAPWVPEPHLSFLLRCHAPTLEHVTLRSDLAEVKAVGELLSRAGHLVQLRCGLMEDMSALLQCTELADLTLDVKMSSPAAFREAKEFLQRAASLKDVTFQYFDDLEDSRGDLVGGLASPHHAAVEKVSFLLTDDEYADYFVHDMTERFMTAFANALPWLPGLREVHVVGEALPSFMEAISPSSAPSLRLVYVKLEGDCLNYTWPCAHSFMHRDDVCDVLQRNPLLHVKVVALFADCFGLNNMCQTCDEGDCHTMLHDRFDEDSVGDKFVTLYSHPEGAACDILHLKCETDENSFAFSLEAI